MGDELRAQIIYVPQGREGHEEDEAQEKEEEEEEEEEEEARVTKGWKRSRASKKRILINGATFQTLSRSHARNL